MTPDAAANLALALIMAVGAILFRAYVREQDAYRKEVERRFHEAGKATSDLADDVQRLVNLAIDVARHDEQIKELQRRHHRGGG